jgi:hypothetical protein
MIKKYLSIKGKLNLERFRKSTLEIEGVNLEEEYQNVWVFYDCSSGDHEQSVIQIMHDLGIEGYNISESD